MSRLRSVRFDWPGWRADVAERLDRGSIGVGVAWVAVTAALHLASPSDASAVASYTLFKLGIVMGTLAILAVALVAVAHGVSAWVAYPVAGVAVVALSVFLGVLIDPWGWLVATPPPPLKALIAGHLYFVSILVPYAVLYVYASTATHDQRLLRVVEAERAAEAERLAQQRLQTELATVDHDLVLRALRQALAAPEHAAGQAEALLEAVTTYLRAAQQRGASEPGRIAAALAELRQACESRGGGPGLHAMA